MKRVYSFDVKWLKNSWTVLLMATNSLFSSSYFNGMCDIFKLYIESVIKSTTSINGSRH